MRLDVQQYLSIFIEISLETLGKYFFKFKGLDWKPKLAVHVPPTCTSTRPAPSVVKGRCRALCFHVFIIIFKHILKVEREGNNRGKD